MIKMITTMTVAILMTTMMLIMMPRWANVFLFFSVLFTLFLASNVIVLKVHIIILVVNIKHHCNKQNDQNMTSTELLLKRKTIRLQSYTLQWQKFIFSHSDYSSTSDHSLPQMIAHSHTT